MLRGFVSVFDDACRCSSDLAFYFLTMDIKIIPYSSSIFGLQLTRQVHKHIFRIYLVTETSLKWKGLKVKRPVAMFFSSPNLPLGCDPKNATRKPLIMISYHIFQKWKGRRFATLYLVRQRRDGTMGPVSEGRWWSTVSRCRQAQAGWGTACPTSRSGRSNIFYFPSSDSPTLLAKCKFLRPAFFFTDFR